jgi:hypothetical protein
MCGCPKYAHRVLLVTSLMGGGNMSVLDRETRWIMAFRYVHIRPNLPLEIRAVEGVRSPECTYSVTSCDFVGDGRGLGQPGCARPRGSATMSRSRVWRQLPRKQTGCLEDKKPMKRTAWFGVRGPARAPGRTPRELARSGRGALTPNRKPGSRRAGTKEQGKYWHVTAAPPSRGVARGAAGGVGARCQGLRTQRATRPTSCMCSFNGISYLMALANGKGSNEHPRGLGRGHLLL